MNVRQLDRRATATKDYVALRTQVMSAQLAAGSFLALRTRLSSMVVITGSFLTAAAADSGDLQLMQLTAALAACGSVHRSSEEHSDLLDRCGASLAIESNLHRVSFSIRSDVEDLSKVVELLGECLMEPRFDRTDMMSERQRLLAELHYMNSMPANAALAALSRQLYPAGDPRHQPPLTEQLARLKRLTIDDARSCHRQYFRADNLCVAAVGDIDPGVTAALLDRVLAPLPRAAHLRRTWESPDNDAPGAAPPPHAERVHLPGSEQFAVALGHVIRLRPGHPDFVALWLANRILGGGFTSRLVSAVREERGLTYSIHSELADADRDCDGRWQVTMTLSPDSLEAGLQATCEEIARFVRSGVSATELAARQVEAAGAFEVGLATLGGLSESLLHGAEQGWGGNYLRDFVAAINAVDMNQLNRVIQQYFKPEQLQTAIAGPSAEH